MLRDLKPHGQVTAEVQKSSELLIFLCERGNSLHHLFNLLMMMRRVNKWNVLLYVMDQRFSL